MGEAVEADWNWCRTEPSSPTFSERLSCAATFLVVSCHSALQASTTQRFVGLATAMRLQGPRGDASSSSFWLLHNVPRPASAALATLCTPASEPGLWRSHFFLLPCCPSLINRQQIKNTKCGFQPGG